MIKSIEGASHFIIDDNNYKSFINPIVDGEHKKTGLIPRDYNTHPVGFYSSAVPFEALDMELIDPSEYDARYDMMVKTKSFLSDIRRSSGPNGGVIPSLDQDGVGYCWNHSVTMGVMLSRAIQNAPYKRLSAFMIGCLIKNYRDEGGWGAQALEFVMENGVPSVEFWPEKSMNRSNDNAAMRANAALHKVTEGWVDLGSAVYDRNLTDQQAMTCLFNRIPVVGDFNWWGHSVILMDPVRVEAGHWGKKGLNSWTDGWGDVGEFTLTGSKAILDGGVGIRTTNATTKFA